MKQVIKIAVADDHELFRKALISLLEKYKTISIIQEASNGKDLLKSLNNKTNIVLLDLDMPGMNGLETFKIIQNKFPGIKVIILSMHFEEAFIIDIARQGVNGFVTKGCSVETLVETIQGVFKNEFFFKQSITAEIIKSLKENKTTDKKTNVLTVREIEILDLICKGHSHKQIANSLFITTRTVDFHKANLYKKTKSNCTANLYQYALEKGLLANQVKL